MYHWYRDVLIGGASRIWRALGSYVGLAGSRVGGGGDGAGAT